MSQPGTISAIPGVNDAQLFVLGTDTPAGVADFVEAGTMDPSHYTIQFDGVTPGTYRLVLRIGTAIVAIEDRVTVTANGWSVPSGGVDHTAQLTRIENKTDLLGTGAVAVIAMVSPTGEINSPIIIGDDYLEVNGRAFQWTVPAVPGVTVGAAEFYFGGKPVTGGPGWLVLGEVSDAGGGNWLVSAELTRTATGALGEGLYRWSGEIRDVNGNEVTRIRSDSNRHVQLLFKQT
jgi:hypothetical protein